MERRNVALILSLSLLWMSWIGFQLYRASKQPPVAADKPAAAVAQADNPADGQPQSAEKAAEKNAQADRDARLAEPELKNPPADAADRNKAQIPANPRESVALGSADPASGYAAVFYFDNRGATVECVELNGPGYKSVDDYSGYLGRLSLTTSLGRGAEVQVVAPGTPAALAKSPAAEKPGLAKGDIIQTIDENQIDDAAAVSEYLREKTRPGQSISIVVLRNDVPLTFTTVLTRRPLEVVHPEAHNYKTPNGGFKFLSYDQFSLELTLDTIGRKQLRADDNEIEGLPSLYNSNWKIEDRGPDFVEFSFAIDEAALADAKIEKASPLKVFKRYTVAKSEKPGDLAYHLNLQVRVQNSGDQPTPIAYRLNGPTGLPLEGWWYSTKLSHNWGGEGARDVVWEQTGLGHQLLGCPKIVSDKKQAEKDKKPPLSPLLVGDRAAPFDYAGVDTQFFASVIQPLSESEDKKIQFRDAFARAVQDVDPIPKTRLRTADVSFRLTTAPTSVEAGGELKHDYRVFFGPKDPKVLSDYKLDALIEYGWPIFAMPAKLLRGVLTGLYGLTWLVGMPNYGISIILLTVIVRTCMIPISLKQAKNAAKMQELAPEIQKIKDKYPDDPMKQHNAVQELYKKHDFNMFGGCLPVFIQLPIFIGLYRCLSVDIDLRDASLFPGFAWASNLAGPDKLFRWDSWMPTFLADEADGYLGPFFNVFPLITVTLFLIQQKMFTPPATDEQTKMQQQMMTYMTVFMGVMFYKVPAGLCIYFITSSLWGICERKLLPKPGTKKEGEGDGGGLFARLTTKPTSPNGSAKPGYKRPKQRK